AAGSPPPRLRDRRATRPQHRLRAPRLTRRRPARPGRFPHRTRPPRLSRTDRGSLVTHHIAHDHDHAHGHNHDHGGPGHRHGLVDRSILRSRAGVKTVSISLAVLAATAGVQVAIFALSGSVALLADLIHNFGDALTAIPLGIAFFLRSYRGEKFAGLFVVLAILVSAVLALYETIQRLIHPQHLTHLWILAAAGVIGFLGNELAAQVRLRGGRRLSSPALVADGNPAPLAGL